MLVIARRAGQALWIGRDVRVEVREIRSHQVKLTISAPPEVTILRTEIGEDPAAGFLPGPEEDPANGDAATTGDHPVQGRCEGTDES